jgi:hypothetical protein
VTAIRRRVLRPPTAVLLDPRREARMQRRREDLAKTRTALKRWPTRLKRATNSVTELHARIGRLEAVLASAD